MGCNSDNYDGLASQKSSTRMGFEPTRAEPNGLAVHRLNHSATSSWALDLSFKPYRFVTFIPVQFVHCSVNSIFKESDREICMTSLLSAPENS